MDSKQSSQNSLSKGSRWHHVRCPKPTRQKVPDQQLLSCKVTNSRLLISWMVSCAQQATATSQWEVVIIHWLLSRLIKPYFWGWCCHHGLRQGLIHSGKKRRKACQNAESNQTARVFYLLSNSLSGDLGNVCVPDKERLHPKMDLEEVSINVLSWN